LNKVQSTAYRKNILTGTQTSLDTRYPNGDNKMNYFGIYAQHLWKSGSEKVIINDGLRLQYVTLHSTIKDNSFFNLPFTDIQQDHIAVTGNLGVVYIPENNTRITAGLSTGFRAPNIDDLARIFESNTASRQLIVPNTDIGPEYTYNGDLGFSQSFGIVRLEATGFYTQFRNAIALAPAQLNGQDSINYNGFTSKVFANQNVAKANLYGVNASVTADITSQLRFLSTINYTKGRFKRADKTEVPLDHIPPVYGKTSISYNHTRFSADVFALYNGWKRLKDYNISGEDNAQYATAAGTPPWITFNFKSTITIVKHLALQLGVENIADRNYRYFASGFSAPGRNYIIALRGTL
jgi:hemoglobin/transferrin/lactoferrin receptor protein